MDWFSWISDPQAWIALGTLLALEVVLGIDNIVFISILAGKLPESQRQRAIYVGLLLAMVTRVLLLFSISWLVGLTAPLFSVLGLELSGRDLILLAGGLFLIYKAVVEIHDKLEGEEGHESSKVAASFAAVIGQILILDVVFSLDSVITAVGMADDIAVMVIAVIVAIIIMLAAAKPIVAFVERHPTVKMLALSFLILIGVSLVAEGLHQHIPKGYIYFSMAFAVMVEFLNLRTRGSKPVTLKRTYTARRQRQRPRSQSSGANERAGGDSGRGPTYRNDHRARRALPGVFGTVAGADLRTFSAGPVLPALGVGAAGHLARDARLRLRSGGFSSGAARAPARGRTGGDGGRLSDGQRQQHLERAGRQRGRYRVCL